MSQTPLAQSADRSVLFHRLGLSEQNPNDQAIHRLMLEEASRGRDRLSSNNANLTVYSMTVVNPVPPYKWDQLSETAKHREILDIVRAASPQTRRYYDMGRYITQVNEENWVVRWYLWHSFRYRDNRDNRNRSNGNGGT
ncbi:hypothetical protein K469DRAFT_600197 [Zopfia rhizophila CBS 207.26]|uniref:Uncharacterized protein n=1 Tax=Zopfia rhizophila CBS 207.26 TaxID=1314779 RepID=A0A6A6DL86_9PEZI|nr:hypothetical protein K469DRAFT_600197 [Zopfia rhizophila CBS 207.26]